MKEIVICQTKTNNTSKYFVEKLVGSYEHFLTGITFAIASFSGKTASSSDALKILTSVNCIEL